MLLSNFGWDALYWYSNRPIGMRIAPGAPVRRAAERMGLPAYVFDYDRAEWLVWRGDNEALLGYPQTLYSMRLPEVRKALAARGARLEQVATFPETLWENRPELYWHRFPKAGHPFARGRSPRGPSIRRRGSFRIHWPRLAAESAPPVATRPTRFPQ